MPYETILYEKSGPVATITLNRPDVLNAINPQLEQELHQALDEADGDADVRAIVLTGTGRAFCTGYDQSRRPGDTRPARQAPSSEQVGDYLKTWWRRDVDGQQKLLHLWYLGTPVIAAVNGWALGGGFWYALAADITLASEEAVFGQPEVRHTSNSSFLFAALVGWKAAHRYALTGDHFDAREAYRLGVVNEVVPLEELMPRARALAERIAKVPEPAVRVNKMVTCFGLLTMGMGAGMLMNVPLSTLAHGSHNPRQAELWRIMQTEGVKAYLEARDGPFQPEPFGPKSRVERQGE